jgi:hypothetical protein
VRVTDMTGGSAGPARRSRRRMGGAGAVPPCRPGPVPLTV